MGRYSEYKDRVLQMSQKLSEHGYFGTRADRDPPARVSGLDYPVDRGASSNNSAVLASALQSRADHTLLWGPDFPIRPSISPCSSNARGIVSTAQVEWRRTPY